MVSGRAPALTARGRLLLMAAGLLSLAGALSSSFALSALGLSLATFVGAAWLAFFPSAVMVWRRHVEMAWTVRGQARSDEASGGAPSVGLVAGRTFELRVTLRNLGPAPLGRVKVRVVASSAIAFDGLAPLECQVGAHGEATLVGEGRALAAGFLTLHGATVEVEARLGVAAIEAYFPSQLSLKVFPRATVRCAPPPLSASGASDERTGLHALRMRGLGGELRELREHAPGDPFKQIAWKATARTGRLMVRDLDRETLVTHHLLVDVAGTMRDGEVGRTKLDHAVELGCAYARAALDGGDRVGLITYEGRIQAQLAPGDGPIARMAITERLMESLTAVDEDLTDLTDGELVAVVARYLRHQESVDAAIARAPSIDDPSWSRIATGGAGELYDLELIQATIRPRLDAQLALPQRRGSPMVTATDPEMARLRIYCRARGIELPPRLAPERGRRARGLSAALEQAARGRGTQRIVILSDLEGLDGPLSEVARTVALARRRGHRLVCIAPSATRSTRYSSDAAAEIIGWAERRREQAARRRIEALGVAVIALPANGSIADVVARMGGRRRRA